MVKGINLISLVWTDGDCRLPYDFRLYNKDDDGLTKNEHFQHMVQQAHDSGFEPQLVVFDSWYSGLDNLNLLRALEWDWLTQRVVDRLPQLASIDWAEALADVFLHGVLRPPDRDAEGVAGQ